MLSIYFQIFIRATSVGHGQTEAGSYRGQRQKRTAGQGGGRATSADRAVHRAETQVNHKLIQVNWLPTLQCVSSEDAYIILSMCILYSCLSLHMVLGEFWSRSKILISKYWWVQKDISRALWPLLSSCFIEQKLLDWKLDFVKLGSNLFWIEGLQLFTGWGILVLCDV